MSSPPPSLPPSFSFSFSSCAYYLIILFALFLIFSYLLSREANHKHLTKQWNSEVETLNTKQRNNINFSFTSSYSCPFYLRHHYLSYTVVPSFRCLPSFSSSITFSFVHLSSWFEAPVGVRQSCEEGETILRLNHIIIHRTLPHSLPGDVNERKCSLCYMQIF